MRLAVLLGLGVAPRSQGMMDWKDFAETEMPVKLPQFEEPSIRPPSFIYATNQLWPPYNLAAESLEPFPGCNAVFAQPCGIQHSIRMVTRARTEVCPGLGGSPDQRQAALDRINSNAFAPEGTTGFGLFLLLPNATIVADPLRPDLVGQRFDGRWAAGAVAQPTLRAHIDWVVRWDGGFVPHFTTRLEAAFWMGRDASVPAVAYFEPCPHGERLGVAIGRKPSPGVQNCNPRANNFCSIQNINRLLGMNLVDYLSSSSFQSVQEQQHKISYTGHYTVGSFYSTMTQICWWGTPGPDPWRNPGPLPDNQCTVWAQGAGQANIFNGENVTGLVSGTISGVRRGDWLFSVQGNAAWTGGAWRDYAWSNAALGDHIKVTLIMGVVWNGSAWYLASGTNHLPEAPAVAPRCQECSPASSLPCAAVNCKRLAAHAQADFLKPQGSFETLYSSRWFGAMHPAAADEYGATWPQGFYVFVFSYNGTCVADGSQPANVGLGAVSLLGSAATDARFKLTADRGGGWVSYTQPDGKNKSAFTIKLAKAGQVYYLGVAYAKQRATWAPENCTSRYAEPCSEQNVQVLVGAANDDILGAGSMAEFLQVLRSIRERTGSYSPAMTGDFTVHVYNSNLDCLPEARDAGITCPPSVELDAKSDLLSDDGANIPEEGTWTDGSRTILRTGSSLGENHRAFIFPTAFAVPGSLNIGIYLVGAVSAASAPARCSSSADCPANAVCNAESRCECNFGYWTEFRENSSACEVLLPASMECTDVRGFDCSERSSPCDPCSAGFYCPHGEPQPCPPGHYCPAGVPQAVACPAGTFGSMSRAVDARACMACEAGTYSGEAARTTCEQCGRGTYSGQEGQSECSTCRQGDYQDRTGQAGCIPCNSVLGLSTTVLRGATDASQCICPAGMYLSDEQSHRGACQPCPDRMVCCLGSSVNNLRSSPANESVAELCSQQLGYPALEPRFWSDIASPLVVFDCHSDDRCPGGRPGSCSPHLEGRSCAQCVQGYYWNGLRCEECSISDASVALFPFVPVLVGFVIPGLLYLRTKDPYKKWGSWGNTIIAILFVLLNHYQTLDVLGSTKVPVTTQLAETYEVMAMTNDFLSLFKISCAGVRDTWNIMTIKAVAPACLGVVVVLWMQGSKIVAKLGRNPELILDPNRLFNVYFSILFTFFGAISAMSLELFKCKDNPQPNRERSLASDASVICFSSSDWQSMLWVSLVSVVLYVGGVGVMLVRAVLVAKTEFSNPTFRRRWSFLLIKFRLGMWWWGLALLAKNFLVNFLLVIFTSPLIQILTIQVTIMVYMILVQMTYPYRSIGANRLEVICCFSIIMHTTVMGAFTFLQEQRTQADWLGTLTSHITYIPIALGGIRILYLGFYGIQAHFGWSMGKAHVARQDSNLVDSASDIMDSFAELVRRGDQEIQDVLRNLGEYERMRFKEVDGILCSELAQKFDNDELDLHRCARSNQLSTKEHAQPATASTSMDSSAFAAGRNPSGTTRVALNPGTGSDKAEKLGDQDGLQELKDFDDEPLEVETRQPSGPPVQGSYVKSLRPGQLPSEGSSAWRAAF